MRWIILRGPTDVDKGTQGEMFIDGAYRCFSLEPPVREIPGVPVEQWKIAGRGKTAIPSGTYELTFVNSPRFGPDTIRVNNVPGFDGVDIHGGTTMFDSEGCVMVGDVDNWDTGEIAGAQRDGVLTGLKDTLREGLKFGKVLLTVTNP
jgi:hypothetical protein